MSRVTLLLRLPPELKDAITARAGADGISANELVLRALGAYLGTDSPDDSTLLSEAVADLIARVAALEAHVAARGQPRPSAPAPAAAAPPEDQGGGHRLADGDRWLTTSQAWQRAKLRGCDLSRKAFEKVWRGPQSHRLFGWGLEKLSNRSSNNQAASYYDLRSGPMPED